MFGVNGPFWAQNGDPYKSGSDVRFFKKTLHNERGQKVDENGINIFFPKTFLFGSNGPFWVQK